MLLLDYAAPKMLLVQYNTIVVTSSKICSKILSIYKMITSAFLNRINRYIALAINNPVIIIVGKSVKNLNNFDDLCVVIKNPENDSKR